jgi:hypothetical protein
MALDRQSHSTEQTRRCGADEPRNPRREPAWGVRFHVLAYIFGLWDFARVLLGPGKVTDQDFTGQGKGETVGAGARGEGRGARGEGRTGEGRVGEKLKS